jgi:hypothetical protein
VTFCVTVSGMSQEIEKTNSRETNTDSQPQKPQPQSVEVYRPKRWVLFVSVFTLLGVGVVGIWFIIWASKAFTQPTAALTFIMGSAISLFLLLSTIATTCIYWGQRNIMLRQWKAMQDSVNRTDTIIDKMQGQLNAIKEQAGIMREALDESRKQSIASQAQSEIAAAAVRIAERNTVAAEESTRIALEQVRPFLNLSATVQRSDTKPEIFVSFQNGGPSKATVHAEFILIIFGSEQFLKQGSFVPFIVAPNSSQSARITDIDARQFDLVVRAGGGQLTLKVIGRYEGVGGPYPIAFCVAWVSGRDPLLNSIDGRCEGEGEPAE